MVDRRRAAASTSKQKDTPAPSTPPSRSKPKAKRGLSTPARRVRTYPSITTTTKQRLHALDSGRCLITSENMPTASQQAVHIVARKTPTKMVKKLEMMWDISPLNLDSTKNIVTLRADWRLSYDHGDWAFVPTARTLQRILKHKTTSYAKPYPGFDRNKLQHYVFVPLPSLRRHYILRQVTEFNEDQDDWSEGEEHDDDDDDSGGHEVDVEDNGDEQGEEGEEEGGEEREGSGDVQGHGVDVEDNGDEQGEEEGGEEREGSGDVRDMVDIEDGNATLHITPFSGFPLLEHHSHPYFVIFSALPKLREHMLRLRPEDNELLEYMTKIEAIWISRLLKPLSSSTLGKRNRRDDPPPPADDDDSHNDKHMTRAAMKHPNLGLAGTDRTKTRGKGKGKGKARETKRTETVLALPQESPYRTPSLTSQPSTTKAVDQVFLFDDPSAVAAWAAAAAVAGPPEFADEVVISSDEEPARPPIQEWSRWHVPYKQPKQRARFCSSDWPMYLYSFPLWMPCKE
ncbi:hypothetical protein D9615_009291 [Tricholomella constricta]|uniref:HNH nuclease domain-containing protein n=1 Tax=Tricholomella constricta TaxID=117010 RepID=A0A8H5GWK2_9AGAR|nr:hypothetical protein D9615_009291 [Tricholomella constricta]